VGGQAVSTASRRSRRTAVFGLLALGGGIAALAGNPAHATSRTRVPPELTPLWPTARLQGEGRLRFLGLHVYDARLWTPDGTIGSADWAQRDFALELQYARALVGRQIAERSLEEIRRGGPVGADEADRWLDAMASLFPDVRPGDRLTGLHMRGEGARFYLNGQSRGEVREPVFARRFFGIWLAPQTSQPQLRAALLGQG
jgi:hypothetical protein